MYRNGAAFKRGESLLKRGEAHPLRIHLPRKGLQTGQGSNPQAMGRWSNDGGASYGTEHWRGVGKAGRTKNRAIWRRLGESRDRVFEMRFSDPTLRDIVGATLYAAGSLTDG